MNTLFRFHLHVEMPNGDRRVTAFNLEAHEARQFQPYDLCSDSFTAAIAGGVTRLGAARIDADREGLAKEIAGELTEAILKAIKSKDLRNGYEQPKQL